jgi:hypothetical protein
MPLQAWHKVDFYDLATDAMAVRYYGFSGRGSYWVQVPATGPGQSRREQRDWALTLLDEAIEMDKAPGKVEYRPPPEANPIDQFQPSR